MRKITPADPVTKTANLVGENLERLHELFPEAFTEGQIDFDVLKQLLGGTIDEREEKYGLNWHGKRRARQLALTPSTGTLRPCPEESVDWDTTQNLMIEGDNLEVLKLLQKSYAGKVKLIYIDPPYNTGKDFVYPDNFQDNIKNYQEITGQIEGGQKVTSNTESSGRFHTDWLNMMYPRLKLAWNVLSNQGLLIASIDEREVQHLRIVANELFGEESFVADVTVVTNLKGRNDKKHIATCHEHIVIYAKQGFASYGLPLTDEQKAAYKHIDENGRKFALRDLRKRGGPDKREDRPNMYFPLYWNASTGRVSLEKCSKEDLEIFPVRGDGSDGRWRWGIDRVRACLTWMHPKKGRNGRLDVEHRVYLDPSVSCGTTLEDEEDEEEDDCGEEDIIFRTSKPKSIWIGPQFSSDSGKRSLKEFLPGDSFSFPKSVELLRQCVQLGVGNGELAIDLFAGSGTLGQAVMAQNAADGLRRRYCLVQLPEPLDKVKKEQRAAALFCESINRPSNLAELTKERLRRVSRSLSCEGVDSIGDLGFRVFKLDRSNIRAWDPDRDDLAGTLLDSVEHILPDRSEQDILYELLLKLGLDLTVPIEQRSIAGKAVHNIGAGALIVCLAERITRDDVEGLAHGIVEWRQSLAPAGDTSLVFRDSAFADDVAKTNLTAILQQHGLDNVRSL